MNLSLKAYAHTYVFHMNMRPKDILNEFEWIRFKTSNSIGALDFQSIHSSGWTIALAAIRLPFLTNGPNQRIKG